MKKLCKCLKKEVIMVYYWNNMKRNTNILMIGLFIFLVSCSHTDNAIVKYIETHSFSQNADTIIDLQVVLGVKYDSMYLFEEFTESIVPKVLGDTYTNLHTIVDSENRIILFNNGKIVYEDDFSNRQICFWEITERPDTVYYAYYVHYGSKYKVSQEKKGYYCLKKCKENHVQYMKTTKNDGLVHYDLYENEENNWQ